MEKILWQDTLAARRLGSSHLSRSTDVYIVDREATAVKFLGEQSPHLASGNDIAISSKYWICTFLTRAMLVSFAGRLQLSG